MTGVSEARRIRSDRGLRISDALCGWNPNVIFALLIVMIGVGSAILHQRTADFMGEDVFYADAARNLLHGVYGVNGSQETTQPPGLAMILAVAIGLFGYSYAVCVTAIVTLETLGFLAAFQLLRHRVGTAVAGGTCVVLMTSPAAFSWATRFVYACFPYFFTTMAALLCAEGVEKARSLRSRALWSLALALAVAASLLIATGTIALLGAMVMVVLATAIQDRQLARRRLKGFVPALALAIAVQGAWMHRKPAPLDWSLPGYPASYLQQLKVKDGNRPEDGLATWKDIPVRVANNVLAGSDHLSQVILRHGVNERKVAMLLVPVLLIAGGWASALWISGGTDFVAWYFAGYSAIYLLWPFAVELRFVLPVAPLACLYGWQGLRHAVRISTEQPRAGGILWATLALLACASTLHNINEQLQLHHTDFTDALLLGVALVSVAIALRMAYRGETLFPSVTGRRSLLGYPSADQFNWIRPSAGAFLVCLLVLIGVGVDARIAQENLHASGSNAAEEFGPSELLTLDVEAAIWLRTHTSEQTIVMARSWPTVAHYAQRKVIWFPPISDPNKLLDGMLRHHVDYVVVIKHENPYYLPDDDYCFNKLLTDNNGEFHLVLQRPNLRIYRFDADELARTREPPLP